MFLLPVRHSLLPTTATQNCTNERSRLKRRWRRNEQKRLRRASCPSLINWRWRRNNDGRRRARRNDDNRVRARSCRTCLDDRWVGSGPVRKRRSRCPLRALHRHFPLQNPSQLFLYLEHKVTTRLHPRKHLVRTDRHLCLFPAFPTRLNPMDLVNPRLATPWWEPVQSLLHLLHHHHLLEVLTIDPISLHVTLSNPLHHSTLNLAATTVPLALPVHSPPLLPSLPQHQHQNQNVVKSKPDHPVPTRCTVPPTLLRSTRTLPYEVVTPIEDHLPLPLLHPNLLLIHLRLLDKVLQLNLVWVMREVLRYLLERERLRLIQSIRRMMWNRLGNASLR